MSRIACAILGSGNIGTDLMVKLKTLSRTLDVVALAGVDPRSEGLRRAEALGVSTTTDGVDGLTRLPCFDDVRMIFDATSAAAHQRHDEVLRAYGKQLIDLTPAALGPYVVPTVNLDAHMQASNVNLVTCGGQATIPIVAAISSVTKVHYAEIVASIASKSAGPGTRANIDEFTETTANAIAALGGATRGKAIIVLNPAEPPLLMRDTVFCLCDDADRDAIARAVSDMVAEVQTYVPGYRLKQAVQFEHIGGNQKLRIPEMDGEFSGLKVSVFLEVEGAGHFLPTYAGNLDIMTSAAIRTAERLAELRGWTA